MAGEMTAGGIRHCKRKEGLFFFANLCYTEHIEDTNTKKGAIDYHEHRKLHP